MLTVEQKQTRHCKIPGHLTTPEETEYIQERVRSRQETIKKNLKNWNVLNTIYRNDAGDHGYVFRACAVIKQIAINNGESLFQTGYKDPPFDAPDPDNPPQNTGWQRANYMGGADGRGFNVGTK